MAKERLDLMIDGTVKRMLREVAASEGLSMSQLVEVMLMEHLTDDSEPENPMWAVSDMLWIKRLQDELEQAMGAGTIFSFRRCCHLDAAGELPDADAPIVMYVGTSTGRFQKDDLVLDCCVDELHNDIVSTYDDVLKTVSVRLDWAEEDDGTMVPYGLRVWPKGRAEKSSSSLFDWECPVAWKGRGLDSTEDDPYAEA